MAFADPQSVTIAGTAVSLPLTSRSGTSGAYGSADGNTKLSISHSVGKRKRRVVRLDNQKIASDPLLAGVNVLASMSAYLVIDVPITGFTVTEQKAVVDALTAYLTASTGANVTKVLGGES